MPDSGDTNSLKFSSY